MKVLKTNQNKVILVNGDAIQDADFNITQYMTSFAYILCRSSIELPDELVFDCSNLKNFDDYFTVSFKRAFHDTLSTNKCKLKFINIPNNVILDLYGAFSNGYENNGIKEVEFSPKKIKLGYNFFQCVHRNKTITKIDAILDLYNINAFYYTFTQCDNFTYLRIYPNSIRVTSNSAPSGFGGTYLNDDSIVSVVNGLNEDTTGTFIADWDSSKWQSIYGTYTTDTNEYGTHHIFTKTGISTDMTLGDFATNIKGWTVG